MTYNIGIDIGLQGAITVLNNKGTLVSTNKIPTIKIKNKNIYDTEKIFELLNKYKKSNVVMEQLSARPAQGVSSMFSLGYGCGLLFGLNYPIMNKVIAINPKIWQNYLAKKYINKDIENKFNESDYYSILDTIENDKFKKWFEKYINQKSAIASKIKSTYIYYLICKDNTFDIDMIKFNDNNITDSYLIAFYTYLNF